ncbi:MAG: ABC transporter ATP-binding protein [Candidatus Binatia bacterium]
MPSSARAPAREDLSTSVPAPDDRAVLEVTDVTVRFGGVVAVNGVSMRIRPGEIVGLLGPNGAGKTTLFNAISGFAPLSSGRIAVDGLSVQERLPYERVLAGLGRTLQHVRLFGGLTVEENLLAAQHRHLRASSLAAMLRLPSWRHDEAAARARVERMLEVIDLRPWRNRYPWELSYGTLRFLELASVLSLEPKVLLLDEPATGIQQKEVEEFGPLLRRIRDETGCAILLIEHDMSLLFGVSERIYALDFGSIITEGRPDEVASHARVLESYLGRTRREGEVDASA